MTAVRDRVNERLGVVGERLNATTGGQSLCRLDGHMASAKELEGRMAEAARQNDFEEHDRLAQEQKSLVKYIPQMTHSFEENAKVVVFHPQMIADFNTVEELGRKMLKELDR